MDGGVADGVANISKTNQSSDLTKQMEKGLQVVIKPLGD